VDRKIILTVAAAVLSGVFVTGCTDSGRAVDIKNADPKDGYALNVPMGAGEYSQFIANEVSAAVNILSSRIVQAGYVEDGTYPYDSEMDNIDTAISGMEGIRDNVDVIPASKTLEDDRKSLLKNIGLAIEALNNYRQGVKEKDNSKIEASSDQMKSASSALTALSNPSYQ